MKKEVTLKNLNGDEIDALMNAYDLKDNICGFCTYTPRKLVELVVLSEVKNNPRKYNNVRNIGTGIVYRTVNKNNAGIRFAGSTLSSIIREYDFFTKLRGTSLKMNYAVDMSKLDDIINHYKEFPINLKASFDKRGIEPFPVRTAVQDLTRVIKRPIIDSISEIRALNYKISGQEYLDILSMLNIEAVVNSGGHYLRTYS